MSAKYLMIGEVLRPQGRARRGEGEALCCGAGDVFRLDDAVY